MKRLEALSLLDNEKRVLMGLRQTTGHPSEIWEGVLGIHAWDGSLQNWLLMYIQYNSRRI
jgi:hypothetical protein